MRVMKSEGGEKNEGERVVEKDECERWWRRMRMRVVKS